MHYKLRRLATVSITSLLVASQVLPVQADTADDIAYLEQQQAETNAELSAVQTSIADLETQKKALLDQIDAYDQDLVTVMASINLITAQISDKEKALVELGKELQTAEKDRDIEYEAMKERIRYVYEEGGNAGWASLLLGGAVGISNILDQAQHTQDLYNYDRKELTAYTESVARVENLQQKQQEEKSTLETMKREQEEGKKYLEELLKKAEEESVNTDARLSEANALAAQYQALIEEQNAAIAELYARQEEERRAAEEAAAREAAAREAAAARSAAAVINSISEGGAEAESTEETDAQTEDTTSVSVSYEEETYDETGAESYEETGDVSAEEESYEETYEESYEESYDEPVSSGGVSGQDVVNLALQYVGNPYVWGGTNPSTGADCSGFVQAIYSMLGYNISRTSYTQLNDGIAVSYADAQPGDIINYGHHVAIYMGNGSIVHAANEQLGICTSSNAAYQPIVGVRRIIY